jgi:hypothetical protein
MSLFERLFSAGVHARPASVIVEDLSTLTNPAVPIRIDELRWKGELDAQRALEATAAGKALLAAGAE